MIHNTLEAFSQQQQKSLALLQRLEQFLTRGENLGVEIAPHLRDKIIQAITQKQNERLKIALIGGYSEGKTSIAAAWLGRQQEDMRISQEESTDELHIYHVDEDIEIIDTPGLHGFKQKGVGAEAQAYKDITRKYISQAHLLLYVMNPSNPIKESHKDDLVWLFGDLKLLDRSVFVLGKFDEMADVEDEDEYRGAFKVARDNVVQGLKHAINLSAQEEAQLAIVAVAANPFGNGLEYWLARPSEYEKISHISELQRATKEAIERSGGAGALMQEMRQSVISDVLHTQLPIAQKQCALLQKSASELSHSAHLMQKDVEKLKGRISEARIHLREFAGGYFADLILQLQGTSMESFSEFFERNIGSEGVVLEAQIQNTFEKELGSVVKELSAIQIRCDEELRGFSDLISSYGKLGVSWLTNSGLINGANIKIARDMIVSVVPQLKDILKFKPWGAANLAGKISAFLSALTLLLEAWDSYKQAERENVFAELKQKLKESFEKQRKEILGLINDEAQFIRQFFAGFITLQEQLEIMQSESQSLAVREQELEQWRKDGELIDVEFKEIV